MVGYPRRMFLRCAWLHVLRLIHRIIGSLSDRWSDGSAACAYFWEVAYVGGGLGIERLRGSTWVRSRISKCKDLAAHTTTT